MNPECEKCNEEILESTSYDSFICESCGYSESAWTREDYEAEQGDLDREHKAVE